MKKRKSSKKIPTDKGNSSIDNENEPKDLESLLMIQKVKNEGDEIVPNVEKAVYQQVRMKKHFSFHRFAREKWLPILSGGVAAALAVATIAVVSDHGINSDYQQGSYVMISVIPASYIDSVDDTITSHEPGWSFSVTSQNVVESETLVPENYSASLVGIESANLDGVKADVATSTLLSQSYEKGYLETQQENKANAIKIKILSEETNYEKTYKSAYVEAVNKALLANQIYANVNFSVVNLGEASFNKLPTRKKRMLLDIYTSLADASSHTLSLDDFENADSKIIRLLSNTLEAIKTAKLTTEGLAAFKEGLAESYSSYLSKTTSKITSQEAEQAKANLFSAISADSSSWNEQNIKHLLNNDAYYIMGDEASLEEEYPEAWASYSELHDYVLSTVTQTDNSYIAFLRKVKNSALKEQTDTGFFPDNSLDIDQGNHSHGDGPSETKNWGPGGGQWN